MRDTNLPRWLQCYNHPSLWLLRHTKLPRWLQCHNHPSWWPHRHTILLLCQFTYSCAPCVSAYAPTFSEPSVIFLHRLEQYLTTYICYLGTMWETDTTVVIKIYIEHKIFCQLKHDQDWSVNLSSGSRQGRLLLDPFNINYIVIWTSFHNTK